MFRRSSAARLSAASIAIALISFAAVAHAQTPSNDEFAPLVLVRIIPMPDVQGRFDHMAVDK